MWMRPSPLGKVNSALSTPILRSTHSSASTRPVEMAMRGMSPSVLLRGSRVISAGSGLSAQGVILGIFTCRRQRPTWITSGRLSATGTFLSRKLPSGPVAVITSGEPEETAAHMLQLTPGVKGSTVALGT
jgi:hypothetical protein